MKIRADRKVFIREKMIFGFTTSFRMGQLLQYRLTIPRHPKGMSDYEYLVTEVIEAVRRCFRDGGFSEKQSEQEKGGDFLLGYHGRLYHISSDFQVGLREENYDAIGCGSEVALGALYATSKTDLSSVERIGLALEAAAHLNMGVRGPFHTMVLPRAQRIRGQKKIEAARLRARRTSATSRRLPSERNGLENLSE
jgi:hypothetical protein